MSFRVTERQLGLNNLRNLQGNLGRLGTLQEQLSSGKQISRPSDSPTGTISAMAMRGELRQLDQYDRNVSDGKAWLQTADTSLQSAVNLVQKVRELALQGRNTGSMDDAARGALATQIDSLRSSLLDVANTTYLDRPIFGGTTAGTVAFDSTGAYVGDSGSVDRTAGAATKVRVDVDGQAAFGTGSNQLFSVLERMSSNLRNDPTKLEEDINALDTSTRGMQTQLADVGARYNRITQAGEAAVKRMQDMKSDLTEVEDIDLPSTITEFQLAQSAYQVALSATAKVVQPSLLDFLR